MTLADEVASYPGGGAFAAVWRQVDGDAAGIRQLAADLRAAGASARRSQTATATSVAEVDSAWHGGAAGDFSAYMHNYGQAAGRVQTALTDAAGALDTAAQAVEDARTAVNSVASSVLAALEKAAPYNTELHRAVYQALVQRAIAGGVSQASPHVMTLQSALTTAATAVRSADTMSAFTDLKPAGATTYLPAPGQVLQWSPVPHASPATTVPSSYSASGGQGFAAAAGGSGAPPLTQPTGDVADWIAEARKILIANGVPASKINAADLNLIIQHESAGNPHAENLVDSNAASGHPSKGLMQTIDSTFDAYSVPGHTDIWNPVDNIVAGVRYALSRYGSLDNVPGVRAVAGGGSYVGY